MSEPTKQDIPTPWLEEGSSTPHFRASTAAAYKRGEYGDIPNDELLVIQDMLNRTAYRSTDSVNLLIKIAVEFARRIKAAGIELV